MAYLLGGGGGGGAAAGSKIGTSRSGSNPFAIARYMKRNATSIMI